MPGVRGADAGTSTARIATDENEKLPGRIDRGDDLLLSAFWHCGHRVRAQVNGKLQAGDIAGAQDAANKAKMFCWIGFGIGLPVNLIVIIVQALAVMASSGAQM